MKNEDPYKNNSYLRDDKEALQEVLFFEQFGKQVSQDTSDTRQKTVEFSEKETSTMQGSGGVFVGVDTKNESPFMSPESFEKSFHQSENAVVIGKSGEGKEYAAQSDEEKKSLEER